MSSYAKKNAMANARERTVRGDPEHFIFAMWKDAACKDRSIGTKCTKEDREHKCCCLSKILQIIRSTASNNSFGISIFVF